MHRIRGILAVYALLVAALSSCSTPPPQATASKQDTEAAPEQREVTTGGMVATGELVPTGGEKISGTVLVTVSEPAKGPPPTTLNATITFSDLSIPYENVQVGGTLSSKAIDPCFDTGSRAGGGEISPNSLGFAEALMPIMVQGETVQEVVLYLGDAPVDEDSDCLQSIVARAALNWQTQ